MRFDLSLCLAMVLLPVVFASADEAAPRRIGQTRQLFFDDQDVATTSHVHRHWHQPVKRASPVLTGERPWEGRGPYTFGNVIQNPSLGTFQLWYNCYVGGQPDYFACYATSRDGLNWDRPACDVVSDPRLPKGNNVVMTGSGLPNSRQCLSPTVFFRPDDPDPEHRYAMVFWDINSGSPIKFVGLCLAYSPDGIHWSNHPENPVFTGTSDVTDASYDPVRKRYLLHYKIWRVDGEAIASEVTRGKIGDVSHWPTWDTTSLEGGKVRFTGQVIDYHADDTRPMRGSVDFARPPKYRRVVARAESPDLVHWTNAKLAFELPEQGDAADVSTYGMSVYPYEGHYIGLLRVFHNDREIDLELTHSRDDLAWKRTSPRQPFLPLGTPGQFDAGMVFSSNALVNVGDEHWFYYGAFTGDHAAPDDKQSMSIGLAKLRRDGFVSLAADDTPGGILTSPLLCDGHRLLINATATHGSVEVELRDAAGKPYPGFAFADCNAFHDDDALSHAVNWQGTNSLTPLHNKPVSIAFRLKNSQLYAYQFQQNSSPRKR